MFMCHPHLLARDRQIQHCIHLIGSALHQDVVDSDLVDVMYVHPSTYLPQYFTPPHGTIWYHTSSSFPIYRHLEFLRGSGLPFPS